MIENKEVDTCNYLCQFYSIDRVEGLIRNKKSFRSKNQRHERIIF